MDWAEKCIPHHFLHHMWITIVASLRMQTRSQNIWGAKRDTHEIAGRSHHPALPNTIRQAPIQLKLKELRAIWWKEKLMKAVENWSNGSYQFIAAQRRNDRSRTLVISQVWWHWRSTWALGQVLREDWALQRWYIVQ